MKYDPRQITEYAFITLMAAMILMFACAFTKLKILALILAAIQIISLVVVGMFSRRG